MAELILEPYAVSQHWKMLPGAVVNWPAILGEYLITIAQICTQNKAKVRALNEVEAPCVIGHIKALALFPGGKYLQVSVVSPSAPVTLSGAAPAGIREVELTLNVIVYGLERRLLQEIAAQVAAETARKWKGEVSAKEIDAGPAAPGDLHKH